MQSEAIFRLSIPYRDDLGGPNSRPYPRVAPLYPERVFGPSGHPSSLNHNLTLAFLTTKPNLRCVTTVPINRLWLIGKCDCGSYVAHIDHFACNRIRRQSDKASS